jgi:hypothetical protein
MLLKSNNKSKGLNTLKTYNFMENRDSINQRRKIEITIVIGLMVILLAILISIVFEFGIVANLTVSWILTTLYALFAFFMIEPTICPVRYIEKPIIKEIIKIVEKPVIKEIQIPIENKTIEVVDRPVIQEVIREIPVEIEKEVIKYIERKPRILNIPKFKFIGSTETKTYHKRTCKFSKMLKNKYKLHSNTKALFKRKYYKACKTCISNKL